MINEDELYIVIDIEADGPVPGLYSMLSIGAVATSKTKEVDTFYAKLLPLKEAAQLPDTMAWWRTQPEAWKEVTTDQQSPEEVMKKFCDWLEHFQAKLIVTAHPIGFDYSFVSWYLWKFVHKDPFTDTNGAVLNLDISSYISGRLHLKLEDSRRTKLPEQLLQGMPDHSHNALDDARGYGAILRSVLANK